MIVVVADEDVVETTIRAFPEQYVSSARTVDGAKTLLADGDEAPTAVVVDRASIPDADAVLDLVRADEFGESVPAVVLTPDPAAEAVLRACDEAVGLPVDAAALRAGVERARQVHEYRDAVDDLYEQCVERARRATTDPGDEPEALSRARERADELLDDLDRSSELFRSLLRQPTDESDER